MTTGITVIDGFLDVDGCQHLIYVLMGALEARARAGGNVNTDFDGREVSYAMLPRDDTRELMDILRTQICDIAACIYSPVLSLYPEFTDLVKWPEGTELHEHVDNEPGRFDEHRAYSSVLYLNDGYGGGHTRVCRKAVQPVTGRLLIFPSQLPHEVERVNHGTRYTLASWYTHDPTKQEA